MSKTHAEQRSCIYLNGEPVDSLPQWALDKMAENLSLVVSLYFREHPDEYERYLNSKEHQEYLMKRRSNAKWTIEKKSSECQSLQPKLLNGEDL